MNQNFNLILIKFDEEALVRYLNFALLRYKVNLELSDMKEYDSFLNKS